MGYQIKQVNGHVEVFDTFGGFVFSADTFQEAENDLKDMAA